MKRLLAVRAADAAQGSPGLGLRGESRSRVFVMEPLRTFGQRTLDLLAQLVLVGRSPLRSLFTRSSGCAAPGRGDLIDVVVFAGQLAALERPLDGAGRALLDATVLEGFVGVR